jgi:hypothetical protein
MTLNQSVTIAGITEPVIAKYFDTLNAGDFAATASLFASQGELHPPFEYPVVGRGAIAAYLSEEAAGMVLSPRQGSETPLEDNAMGYEIRGKVQTSVFAVNVAWNFVLNSVKEIQAVEVKLLASAQELLNLRR